MPTKTVDSESIETEVIEPTHLGEYLCDTWDGRKIYIRPEEEIDTAAIIEAQSKSVRYGKGADGKKEAKTDLKLLLQLMAIALFTVEGESLTVDMLIGAPRSNPKAIGWKAMAVLQTHANEAAEGIPTGKT